MKKALAIVLTLVMLVGCLAGCGNNANETEAPTKAPETKAPVTQGGSDATEAPAEEKEWFGTEDGKTVTINFWAGIQPEYGYDQMVKNFNEEYKDKGVQIEYTRFVNNAEGNLQLDTYLMGGGTVDVFMNYGGRSALDTRVESNMILNIADRLEAYGFDPVAELGEASMANFMFDDGSYYGFPTKYENNRWMLINVDMFEAAGVEIPYDGWTYSEFLAALEKLTHGEGQDKVYGAHMTIKGVSAGLPGILGSVLGGNAVYADAEGTKLNYDNKVWKEAFEMLKTGIDNEWIISLEDEISEGLTVANCFLEEKCAISTNISQMRICMDTATYPHDFTTALVPGPVPDGEEYNTEYYRTHAAVSGAGDTICIAQKTAYPDACFEFIMWYVKGGMAPLAKGGRIPLWSGFDQELVVNVLKENAGDAIDMESLSKYLSIDNTKGVVDVNGYAASEIQTVWLEELHEMAYGRKSVDDALASIMTRGQALIDTAMANQK